MHPRSLFACALSTTPLGGWTPALASLLLTGALLRAVLHLDARIHRVEGLQVHAHAERIKSGQPCHSVTS